MSDEPIHEPAPPTVIGQITVTADAEVIKAADIAAEPESDEE